MITSQTQTDTHSSSHFPVNENTRVFFVLEHFSRLMGNAALEHTASNSTEVSRTSAEVWKRQRGCWWKRSRARKSQVKHEPTDDNSVRIYETLNPVQVGFLCLCHLMETIYHDDIIAQRQNQAFCGCCEKYFKSQSVFSSADSQLLLRAPEKTGWQLPVYRWSNALVEKCRTVPAELQFASFLLLVTWGLASLRMAVGQEAVNILSFLLGADVCLCTSPAWQ